MRYHVTRNGMVTCGNPGCNVAFTEGYGIRANPMPKECPKCHVALPVINFIDAIRQENIRRAEDNPCNSCQHNPPFDFPGCSYDCIYNPDLTRSSLSPRDERPNYFLQRRY